MHYAVYEVLRPIDWLGARPGDILIAEPGRADAPLQLVREYDRSALVAILSDDQTLRLLDHSLDPPSDVLSLKPSSSPPPELVQHVRRLQAG